MCYDIVIDDPCADPNITVQEDSCGVYFVASDNSLGGIPCWYIDGQTVSIGIETETLTFSQNGTYIISYNLVGNSCPDYSWYDTLIIDCFNTLQDSLACWLNYTYTAIDSCTFEFIGIPMHPNSTVTWLINGVSYPGSTLIHTFQLSGAHQVVVQVFNPITGCNETYFVDVITTACSLNNPIGGGNNPILNLNTNAFNFWGKERIVTNLYPNPASQYFIFEGFKSLEVYDNYGRLILILTSNRAAVQDLSAGEYIVKGFREDGFVEAKKLIVKH